MTTTVYTLAARESVLAIREAMAATMEPSLEDMRRWAGRAVEYASLIFDDWKKSANEIEWEAVELWATLASDLSGMIRERMRREP